jgi:signal peptidase I
MLHSFKAWLTRPRSKTRETIETCVMAAVIAFGFRAEVASAFFIPSESMLPTLEVGDRLLVDKVSSRFEPPHRGDIVVFDPPPQADPPTTDAWIKRVVGLPGERIGIHDGQVYVDGRKLNEPYTKEAAMYPEPNWAELGMPNGKVPLGSVFVMGDNRNNSADGHVWGALPMKNIIGRSIFRFWPLARLGPVSMSGAKRVS